MNSLVIFKRYNQEIQLPLDQANKLLASMGGGQITPEYLEKAKTNIFNVTPATFHQAWEWAKDLELIKDFNFKLEFRWSLNASCAGVVNCNLSGKMAPVGYIKETANGFEASAYLYLEGHGTPVEAKLETNLTNENNARSWVIQEAIKLLLKHEPQFILCKK